jgi:hypothetical protein
MARLLDPIFKQKTVAGPFPASHDVAAVKTYNYLRLGMLVAVAALAYSVLELYHQHGVNCFLGSLSGYYYTPVHTVFVGVMLAIGLSLIVIKGKTVIEDAALSVAGMLAPIVAFVPTSDDTLGVCRPQLLQAHLYRPVHGSHFIPASISNNIDALLFAGWVAIALLLITVVLPWQQSSKDRKSALINLLPGLVLVTFGTIVVNAAYLWVLQAHAKAAVAMFGFLAVAALADSWTAFKVNKLFASVYGVVGLAMIGSGIWFIVVRVTNPSSFNGHLVLIIEAIEIGLFVIFWAFQTIERWNQTV